MGNEKMLAKIRGLLNKAEDPSCTPQEAETLTAKAAELMAKYAIDEAMVDAARARPAQAKVTQRTISFAREDYALRKITLLYTIARAHRCQAIRTGRGESPGLIIFGFESDLDLSEMLYTSLLVQAQRALAKADVPYFDNARSFRTSWWAGYTVRIAARLSEANRKAEAESAAPGTALVLADRSVQVRSAYDEAFPKRRTGRVGGGTSGSGYRHGDAAGRTADIGGAKLGSRSAGALN